MDHGNGLNKVLLIGYVRAVMEGRGESENPYDRPRSEVALGAGSVVLEVATGSGDTEISHKVVCRGELAAVCRAHVRVGRLIYIEGRLDPVGILARRIDMIGHAHED